MVIFGVQKAGDGAAEGGAAPPVIHEPARETHPGQSSTMIVSL